MQRASVFTMHPAASLVCSRMRRLLSLLECSQTSMVCWAGNSRFPRVRRTTYGRQRAYGQGHADVLPLTRQASRSDILSREGRSHPALLSRYTPRVDRPVSQREQSDHHSIAASLARILPRKTSRQHSVPEAS